MGKAKQRSRSRKRKPTEPWKKARPRIRVLGKLAQRVSQPGTLTLPCEGIYERVQKAAFKKPLEF